MSAVIVRNATYESDALRPLILGMMEAMEGNEIRKESRVLIKPNLLSRRFRAKPLSPTQPLSGPLWNTAMGGAPVRSSPTVRRWALSICSSG